jgi:hypothetical protein
LTYNEFALTGNISSTYNCKTASYDMKLSWSNLDIIISKWLASFTLSWTAGFTWSIDFMQCTTTFCKQIGQLIVDTRTQSIQKSLCLTLSWSECTEWDR